ncbi:MAG: bifunctional RNase H/acid phosphatase [Nocardioidaceae bacterium]
MSVPRRVVVEADGGSRGNPGPAAYGAVLRDAVSGTVLAERAEAIGVATNNVAEYRGLIAGLELAREHAPDASLEVRLDSKLVVEQMSGRWKVKHPDMRPLALQAQRLAPTGVSWTWVPRAQNAHADRLLNEALDTATGRSTARSGLDANTATGRPTAGRVWDADTEAPTVVVLLRHGATTHTEQKRFSGSGGQDLSLGDAGIAQARAAAVWLRERGGVDVLVSSPLARARETAVHVGDLLGLEVATEDGLREASFGDWDGHTFADVQRKWPNELDAWLSSSAVAPPGGESADAVSRRVRRTRDRLIAAHPGSTIVAVSHVTPIKMLVRSALGAPLDAIYRMELAPGSITELAWYADGRPSMRRFNVQP